MSAVVVLILRILIAVALYAFVAWAFFLLWKTLRKPADARSGSGIPALTLQPAKNTGMEPQRFEVEEVLVGREKSCRLCLSDDTISARHALLSFHNKQWWVEDLGSTNGTYLNTLPVTTPTVLVKGDALAFGKVSLVVGFE
jgi:pSer/pThr/pTyr-binding forkhead associated (FHA) protein